MKMKLDQPLFFVISLLLVASLACSFGGATPSAGEPTSAPAVQQEPTASGFSLNPTEAPSVTEAPTEPPTPEAQKFFTDEFDSDTGWSYFVIDGNSSQITKNTGLDMTISTGGGVLTYDLQGEGLWVYDLYLPVEYTDVRLDARVNNRGVNNNNVSLICRYTEDGWYEFNIANNGLYWILVASVDDDQKVAYDLIYNGGSNKIKSGKETNEYTAICKGNQLSLFINGEEARTVTDSKYVLPSGLVGTSVSSFDTLPVIVDFEWVKISEP
jgi:hypothetical protein